MSLFDGKNGRSDGTKNGDSLFLDSINKTVSVHGVFGGATVTLMRYSSETNRWFATKSLRSSTDELLEFFVNCDAKYKLQIDDATSATNIIAEA